MKRIEFIAPVESMRGNLSGAQKLEYPTDNKGAYEGPVGSVNYARNYGARFIGAKIAKSGKKYFSVRTKTANHLTVKAKHQMALLGGTGAMVGAILRNKSAAIYTSLMAMYIKLQELGEQRTFRKYLSDKIMEGLQAKSATIVFTGPLAPVSVDNPWNTTETTPNVQVSQAVLVKFWSELAANPVSFTIEGLKGIAHSGDTFDDVVGSNYNVLGLQKTSVTSAQGTTCITSQGSTSESGQYLAYDYEDIMNLVKPNDEVTEYDAEGYYWKAY